MLCRQEAGSDIIPWSGSGRVSFQVSLLSSPPCLIFSFLLSSLPSPFLISRLETFSHCYLLILRNAISILGNWWSTEASLAKKCALLILTLWKGGQTHVSKSADGWTLLQAKFRKCVQCASAWIPFFISSIRCEARNQNIFEHKSSSFYLFEEYVSPALTHFDFHFSSSEKFHFLSLLLLFSKLHSI